MRTRLLLLCLFCNVLSIQAQYYIRGEISDDKGNMLQNVKILLHSTGLSYSSGVGGAFGILTNQVMDSLSFQKEGYEPLTLKVRSTSYQTIKMKMLPFTASLHEHHLLSFTEDLDKLTGKTWYVGGETYNRLVENAFLPTTKFPVTAIAPNSNTASYSNIRRFINMGSKVPPDAVRIEEMMNYFNFGYTPPSGNNLFLVDAIASSCPWNSRNRLLFLKVCTKKVSLEKVPPSNLVFLVDVSGSMDSPNKLPLLQAGFRKLVEHLRPIDTISIVVYGGAVGAILPPTGGDNKKKILEAINGMAADGHTPGEAGIRQAYRLARSQFIKDGNNRVILATDGDFNVGTTSEIELDALITQQKQTGIYLTCLGVGMGNYKDSKIEVLARKGNGNFAYLDHEQEAEKVLVKELTQNLYTVAEDVLIDMQFNPASIAEYRLIGYDNKLAALTDSLSTLEGGEFGSGHSMLALFELVPQPRSANPDDRPSATAIIKYKLPGKQQLQKITYTCPLDTIAQAGLDPMYRFASSVALYGMLLRESPYANHATWDDLQLFLSDSWNSTEMMQQEFYEIVQRSRKVYMIKTPKKKKREQER